MKVMSATLCDTACDALSHTPEFEIFSFIMMDSDLLMNDEVAFDFGFDSSFADNLSKAGGLTSSTLLSVGTGTI